MAKLEGLVRLSDCVVRILGQNPGKFTLQGTNTYLIGESPPYTLIDTGEGRPSYLPLLESALESAPDPHISDIILSHCHTDHTGGLPAVLALLRTLTPAHPPRLHKIPHPSDAQITLELGTYTPAPSGAPFHALRDGQTFLISPGPATFRVLHTPGHTEDSIALVLPLEKALYTADTVLGQGTAVFEDLGTYIASLRALLAHVDADTVLYPGHGPVVHNGREVIKAYIEHRMERECQIVQVLQLGGTWTTWDIVVKIYAAYPPELWEAAAQSVNQHLEKLLAEGKVEKLGGEGKDTQWRLQTKV